MRVIGIAGQQGAGKDYFYEALRDMIGDNVRRMAFADGVRREVSREVFTALGFEIKDDSGMAHWQKPYTAGQRFLLQQWGTEFRREQDPDYWVDYGLDYIAKLDTPESLWCVTDVRFANEAEAIKRVGGKVVLVHSALTERAKRLGLTAEELEGRSGHASEVIDFDADFVVRSQSNGLYMEMNLAEWLGLPRTCMPCLFVQPHVWHDNGLPMERITRG